MAQLFVIKGRSEPQQQQGTAEQAAVLEDRLHTPSHTLHKASGQGGPGFFTSLSRKYLGLDTLSKRQKEKTLKALRVTSHSIQPLHNLGCVE